MSEAALAEKTKPSPTEAAPGAVERLMVLNDKGGIGKSIVIQGLSLELAAAGVDHRVIEAESNARLQRVLGPDRVLFHPLSEDSLAAIRRNPDLVAEYWDVIAEEFTAGVRLLDMGANAGTLFWNWWHSGSGRLMLGDGAGIGALVVTAAEVEAMRLAREALARAAAEMPGARLFVVVNEHQGAMPADHPALDGLCAGAGPRAGEVVRVVLPRCAAPAWQAMVGMGKPLNETATLKPQDLVPLGYRLGAAARSVSDVVEWLGEWRPQLRRLLAAGGTVPPGRAVPARGSSPLPTPAFDDAALAASGLRAKEAWAAESGRERDRLLALPPAPRLAALDDDGVRALLTAEHRAEVRASLAPATTGNDGRERTMAAWTVERRRLALMHALRPAATAGCAVAAILPFATAAWRWEWSFGDAVAAFFGPGPALAGVALAFVAAGVLGRMATRAGTLEGLLGVVAAAFAAGVAGLAVAVAAI